MSTALSPRAERFFPLTLTMGLAAIGNEIDAHQRVQLTAHGLAPNRPLKVLRQRPITVILADEVELALEHAVARHIRVEKLPPGV